MWGSNSRPPDYETDALPTELTKQRKMPILHIFFGLLTRLELTPSCRSLNMPDQLASGCLFPLEWEDFKRWELNPGQILVGNPKATVPTVKISIPQIMCPFHVPITARLQCNRVNLATSLPCLKMSIECQVHQRIISLVVIWFRQHVTCVLYKDVALPSE